MFGRYLFVGVVWFKCFFHVALVYNILLHCAVGRTAESSVVVCQLEEKELPIRATQYQDPKTLKIGTTGLYEISHCPRLQVRPIQINKQGALHATRRRRRDDARRSRCLLPLNLRERERVPAAFPLASLNLDLKAWIVIGQVTMDD